MSKKVKIEKTGDGYLIIRHGSKESIYLDRRAALAWPSVQHPGYFAIYGQLDRYDPVAQRFPLVLLSEASIADTRHFFTRLMGDTRKFGCTRAYLDLSEKTETVARSLARFIRETDDIKCDFPFTDASEFASFEKSYPLIDQYLQQDTLDLPEDSQIKLELRSIRKPQLKRHDGIGPEDLYPAIAALNYIVSAFDIYMSLKAKNRIRHFGRKEGYR